LLTRSEAISRARSGVVGRMATVTPEGKPHVVPFVFVLLGDERHLRAYWAVDQKPKKAGRIRRIENLKANPALEFVVDGYAQDWDLLWWVRVSGRARMVDSDVERAQAIAALSNKYPQYVRAPPGGPVIAVDVQAISSWEATEGPSDPGL
jgi:PPOX class probable F420-dependent enzyme